MKGDLIPDGSSAIILKSFLLSFIFTESGNGCCIRRKTSAISLINVVDDDVDGVDEDDGDDIFNAQVTKDAQFHTKDN